MSPEQNQVLIRALGFVVAQAGGDVSVPISVLNQPTGDALSIAPDPDGETVRIRYFKDGDVEGLQAFITAQTEAGHDIPPGLNEALQNWTDDRTIDALAAGDDDGQEG